MQSKFIFPILHDFTITAITSLSQLHAKIQKEPPQRGLRVEILITAALLVLWTSTVTCSTCQAFGAVKTVKELNNQATELIYSMSDDKPVEARADEAVAMNQ